MCVRMIACCLRVSAVYTAVVPAQLHPPATLLARTHTRLQHCGTRAAATLQVQLDASDLSGFQVAPGQAVTRYKYKNLKAACCNIPAGREHGGSISSKVAAAFVCL